MSCCCNKIKNLCDVALCGGMIETGVLAAKEGTYKLVLDFLGVEYTISQDFDPDEELNFSPEGLNENFTFTGKILDPDGDLVSLDDGSGGSIFDCLSFKTKLSYEINA